MLVRHVPIFLGNDRAYYERSPVNFVDQFTCPVILFQGLEDKVCGEHQVRYSELLVISCFCLSHTHLHYDVP
jgi:dipeptidyl aminopeptidase/acylaminoacyl peptidase